jgi:hypothetical protein
VFASQKVFIVMRVKCDLRFSGGWSYAFALSFASNSVKMHRKRMKCPKQLSVTMPREKYRRLSGFIDPSVGKFWL